MESVTRRTFLGTAGVASGLAPALSAGATAKPVPKRRTRRLGASTLQRDIVELVNQTPLVDTHEHLSEEKERLSQNNKPHADFGMLMSHYSDSDLQVAGLSMEDYQTLIGPDLAPKDKWRLVAPYYARCRHTGYQLCIRETVRALYDEDDISEDNCERISAKLAQGVQPGFYRHILRDIANIEYCQVNALEASVFRETDQPDLLCQDISTIELSTTYLDVPKISAKAGRSVTNLQQWHEVIDWCFAQYGPRAIATKNQSAYSRRLDYAQVTDAEAAPLFDRYLRDKKAVTPAELKTIQDHLFNYCVDKATEYKLPVKMHTGYYAGQGHMPLERVRQNAGDLCPLLKTHRDTKFVFMHIDYPYQDEMIALAKHYPNAYVDMCWGWIINPSACVRFLKEFIMAAPACKLLVFGGDFCPVEMVVGHAVIARRGIAQAFTELVREGWVSESDIPELVDRVMRGNAHELFDYDRVQRNWKVK